MATIDYDKHYIALRQPTSVVQVPNTVSRTIKVGERSFQTVVYESGKPVLDAELQLNQDAGQWSDDLLLAWQAPTGWLKGQSHSDSFNDYMFVDGTDTTDNGPDKYLENNDPDKRGILLPSEDPFTETMVNAFTLPRLDLMVAGRPVVVEYTNTETTNRNLVLLDPPSVFDGLTNFKRTDFVFLECWLSLVAPSPRASGYIQIVDSASIVDGDMIIIDGIDLTACVVAPPPLVPYFIVDPLDNNVTAVNLANAINTFMLCYVFANAALGRVTVKSVARGVGSPATMWLALPTGNFITLETTNPGSITLSGPTLLNGEDRPNKPDQNSLYRHGNVLSPESTWLEDELEDPTLDAESTQRVQLQYRIRVTGETEAVDYKQHPDGFSSGYAGPTAIYAQGAGSTPVADFPFVPADTTSVWGVSSAVAYGKEDTGLWIAGDGTGTSAEALGAVDGFVYAVPICFVFRHNDASSNIASIGGIGGFNPTLNANGAPLYPHEEYAGFLGTIPANASDRPDDEFANVITNTRVMDLRRHVTFPGIDYNGELKYQIQSLMDGSLRTWQVDTADKQPLGGSSGDVSTRFLICNEVGRAVSPPPYSTSNGVLIRSFDHVARRFGSQSVIERLVIAFNPTDLEVDNPGKYVTKVGDPNTWFEGDELNLNLTQFDVSTLGGIFQGLPGVSSWGAFAGGTFSDFAPVGTAITDVLSIKHDDGHYVRPISQDVQASLIQGLGTQYVTIKLDSNPLVANGGVSGDPDYPLVGYDATSGSPRRIFVEFEITYPLGVGTTDTPTVTLTPDSAVYSGNDTTGTSGIAGPGAMITSDVNTRPNDMQAALAPIYRDGFRETHLEYVTDNTNDLRTKDPTPVEDEIVSSDTTTIYTPRRIFGVARGVSVTDISGLVPVSKVVDTSTTEYGSSTRKLKFDNLLSNQSLCAVTYYAQDPIPNYGASGSPGYQVSAYFRANSPQTAGVMAGPLGTPTQVMPNPLVVEPLTMGDVVWSGQAGVGSVDLAFPYTRPLDAIPTIYSSGLFHNMPVPEWAFCATSNITVNDFNADTGLLTLQAYVQGDIQENLTIGDIATSPIVDWDFRACYPTFDPTTYQPTVMASPLYGATMHKVFVPILARVVNDPEATSKGLLFRKNELVLVVINKFAFLDVNNNIMFTEEDNSTCAGVYRTRNLLMVVGDRS